MKKVSIISRIFLGSIFLIFGLNGFLNFIQTPELAPEALAFMMALVKTGYMMPIVKLIEIITGAMMLFNKKEHLALILLAPILFNIISFHIFLDFAGAGMSVLLLIVFIWRVKENWEIYKKII